MPPTPITAGTDVDFQGVALRVRSVDGDLLFLEASDGSFYGIRHVTDVTVCPPPATSTAASLPAPAAGQGEGIVTLKKSWLVIVTFPDKSSHQFRWYKLRDARSCMRDFPSARKELRECVGRFTFDGWVDA